MAFVLAMACILILRLFTSTGTLVKRLVGKHPAAPSEDPEFYRLFCRLFAATGCPLQRGQTPSEYLARLKRERYLDDECDDMIRYLYAICYERQPRSYRREKQMKVRIRHLFEPN
jgi:hypothetical protein